MRKGASCLLRPGPTASCWFFALVGILTPVVEVTWLAGEGILVSKILGLVTSWTTSWAYDVLGEENYALSVWSDLQTFYECGSNKGPLHQRFCHLRLHGQPSFDRGFVLPSDRFASGLCDSWFVLPRKQTECIWFSSSKNPYPKVIIVFSIHIIHTYFICKYRITGKHLSIMSSNMI